MRRSARIATKSSEATHSPPKRKSLDSNKTLVTKKRRSEGSPSADSEGSNAPVDATGNVKSDSEEDVSTSGSEYDVAEDAAVASDDHEMPEDEEFATPRSKNEKRTKKATQPKKANEKRVTGFRKFASPKGPTMLSVPAKKAPSIAKEPAHTKHHFSEGSADEWEDVVPSTSTAAVYQKLNENRSNKEDVEVTIITSEEQQWKEKRAKEIQLMISREKKENVLIAHDVILLCNAIHLRLCLKSLMSEDACLMGLCRSLIPKGYVEKLPEKVDILILKKFMKWFGSAFIAANNKVSTEAYQKNSFVERMEFLVEHKCYDTSRDLAAILFGCLLSMDIIARLGRAVSISKDAADLQNVEEEPKKKKKASKEFRDYFVEFWSREEDRWIAIDPLTTVIDCPFTTAEHFSPGFLYALAIDNKLGVRDVTPRYAEGFLAAGFRKKRTGAEYLKETLKMPWFAANRQRSKAEDLEFHDVLSLRPLPTTLSDFKNHPLYALEKDLLKFEAIYPKDQKPVGKVRDHDVFPRSSVRHLEGLLFWLRQGKWNLFILAGRVTGAPSFAGRCVKEGEEPYKVVKARPKMNVPKEKREDLPLNLFGHWQTEEFVPPVVKPDEPVPRNEYGNIYLYKPSMLPKGCAHLDHPGITSIAKKLQIDHVPAVVGWDFHGFKNHVVLAGIVVHQGDVEILTNAWTEDRIEQLRKVEQKTKKRVMGNWKRLINGAIGLDAIRKKFGVTSGISRLGDDDDGEGLEDGDTQPQGQEQWPAGNFTLSSMKDNQTK